MEHQIGSKSFKNDPQSGVHSTDSIVSGLRVEEGSLGRHPLPRHDSAMKQSSLARSAELTPEQAPVPRKFITEMKFPLKACIQQSNLKQRKVAIGRNLHGITHDLSHDSSISAKKKASMRLNPLECLRTS